MTNINPAAAAAMADARQENGRFGVQQHTAPDVALAQFPPLKGGYSPENVDINVYYEEGEDGAPGGWNVTASPCQLGRNGETSTDTSVQLFPTFGIAVPDEHAHDLEPDHWVSLASADSWLRDAVLPFLADEDAASAEARVESDPLTGKIGEYLREYAEAQEEYSAGGDDSDAYEYWEDFQTDNSARARDLLQDAQNEIERLRQELAAAQASRTIPDELVQAIEDDHKHFEDPTLYIPECGFQSDFYVDVIALSDGVSRKYTLTPDGEIERNFD